VRGSFELKKSPTRRKAAIKVVVPPTSLKYVWGGGGEEGLTERVQRNVWTSGEGGCKTSGILTAVHIIIGAGRLYVQHRAQYRGMCQRLGVELLSRTPSGAQKTTC